MPDSMLQELNTALENELKTTELLILPGDFYLRLATYSQNLQRSRSSGASDATVNLIRAQLHLIESMSRELLACRGRKAARSKTGSALLPEEKYVFSLERRYERRLQVFVEALSSGQPSFIDHAHRKESVRTITVKFTRHVDELVGLDLRHYGPYEPEDVAIMPATSAELLISGGDAEEVVGREDV